MCEGCNKNSGDIPMCLSVDAVVYGLVRVWGVCMYELY